MLVDFPGVMTEFAKVKSGEFFIYFEDSQAALAMKIFDAVSPEKKVGVMSFSTAIHPSMTPPTVLDSGQLFQNRAVCVVRDVVIRPPFQMNKVRSNSPSLDRPGPIIFAIGATYIRPYDRRGTIDIDLATGATEESRAHPGSIWLDDWEIVWVGRFEEKILCERGKPAAAAQVGPKSGG
jgi:hypothetical protein